MADNNLAVNIEVAVKNKTDLDLTASKIRNLQRDIKKLADEGNKDPLAIPKLKAANAELLKLNKTVVDLQKTVHRSKEETEGFGEELLHLAHGNRPIARLIREFGNLGGGIENTLGIFGRFVGGFAGGVAATAGFKGFEILRDQLAEVSKHLAEVKEQGANLGIKPIAAQAIGETAGAAGEDPKAAVDMMQKLSDQLDEARKRINQPGSNRGIEVTTGAVKALGNEIEVVGDKAVKVFRTSGGATGIATFTQNLDSIVRRFPGTEEGKLQQMIASLRQFLAAISAMDDQMANIRSKEQFGLPAETARKNAETMLKQLEAKQRELEESQRGATDPRLKEAQDLKAAQAALGTQKEEGASFVENLVRPAALAVTRWAGTVLPEMSKNWAANNQEMLGGWKTFWNLVNGVSTDQTALFLQRIDAMRSAVASLGSSISGAVSTGLATPGSNIAEPFGGGISGAIGGALPADYSADTGGFARGGFVRGPGTGTSDSILARLSAGEFVVNSASVRRLGTSFLSGLNGYAAGGLVGIPRFAGGGLVSAGGGTPVHLHLGGQSFALSGHDNVVSALVSEAARQQTRSAGVKPSWFGGRAGGH